MDNEGNIYDLNGNFVATMGNEEDSENQSQNNMMGDGLNMSQQMSYTDDNQQNTEGYNWNPSLNNLLNRS